MSYTVHDNVVIPQRTIGLSPKLIAPVITGVIVYALTKLAIPLDPVLEQAIQAISMALASYFAPPGAFDPQDAGPASDNLLSPEVRDRLANDQPPDA